jgi:hypothetical protein
MDGRKAPVRTVAADGFGFNALLSIQRRPGKPGRHPWNISRRVTGRGTFRAARGNGARFFRGAGKSVMTWRESIA